MNFKVAVLTIGIVNIQTGKTQYDWSIYDYSDGYVYLTDDGSLLYASKDSFKNDDSFELYNNDSGRSLGRKSKIIDMSPCVKKDVIEMLFKNKYDYSVKRAFQKAKYKRKLRSSYSVKGIEKIIN